MNSNTFNYVSPMNFRENLTFAKEYTETYRKNKDEHKAIREALCLKVQYKHLMKPMKQNDTIAGRIYYKPLVGFGTEIMTNENLDFVIYDNVPECGITEEIKDLREHLFRTVCGHSFDYTSLKHLQDSNLTTAEEKNTIQDIIDFWFENSTYYKYRSVMPKHIRNGLGRTSFPQYNSSFMRLCCISADYEKLMSLGVQGLRDEINSYVDATDDIDKLGFYKACLIALDIFVDVCRYYRQDCLRLADTAEGIRKRQLLEMADNLDFITRSKPETLWQGIQLFWIYYLLTDTRNFGRMDVYFGDLYLNDLKRGIETEDSAQEIIQALWNIINEQEHEGSRNYRFNSRIILGGRGRRNEESANKFALAALRATEELNVCQPMVTLRFYDGQDETLMDAALRCIEKGKVNPSLYNDDVHIPWCAKAFHVTEREAQDYLPQGCGEIILDHKSIGSPNSIINYITALDLVLHNGFSTEVGEVRGLQFGQLDTFDKLLSAVLEQIDHTNEIFAERHALEHKIEGQEIAYLFLSMLTDDCIKRGKSIVDGGAVYAGGIIETFGLTNLSDSLYAIKTLVYEGKKFTLDEIVKMTDANFEGFEVERQLLLNLPKYGNDHIECDNLHTYISNFVCQSADSKAKKYGLDFFLNCNLNPDGITYAANTKASADGRVYGECMAVGDAPTAGRDKNGITALLNSFKKSELLCAGYVHNLKVSPRIFKQREIFKALLNAYFKDGGNQLMITVQNSEDLIKAIDEPEKYSHIMVRVGGWTARFVELSPIHQQEIINRTLYC